MKPLTLYAERLENGDVAIYGDASKQTHRCTFARWRSDRPTRRNRWLMLNCYRWRLVWLGFNPQLSPA